MVQEKLMVSLARKITQILEMSELSEEMRDEVVRELIDKTKDRIPDAIFGRLSEEGFYSCPSLRRVISREIESFKLEYERLGYQGFLLEHGNLFSNSPYAQKGESCLKQEIETLDKTIKRLYH